MKTWIEINQLNLLANVGILPIERLKRQRLIVTCKGQVAHPAWPIQSLDQGVSYAAVADRIQALILSKHWDLLEDLIDAIQADLFAAYPLLDALELRLGKPDIIDTCQSVGISGVWNRNST